LSAVEDDGVKGAVELAVAAAAEAITDCLSAHPAPVVLSQEFSIAGRSASKAIVG
jgi:hypothetical protein